MVQACMHSDKCVSRYGLLENFNADIISRSDDILSHKDYIFCLFNA